MNWCAIKTFVKLSHICIPVYVSIKRTFFIQCGFVVLKNTLSSRLTMTAFDVISVMIITMVLSQAKAGILGKHAGILLKGLIAICTKTV